MENAHPVIELRNFGQDVERQLPETQKPSWYRSLIKKTVHIEAEAVSEVDTSGTGISDSAKTTINITGLIKWASGPSRPSTPYTPVDPNSAQNEFLRAVTKLPLHSSTLASACNWYIAFLESKIREAWCTLFQPLLDTNVTSGQPNITLAFQILTSVVQDFETQEIALASIVDHLYNEYFFVETDQDRATANQLVFSIFGWISILYSPDPNPQDRQLQIIEGTLEQRGGTQNTRRVVPPRRRARHKSVTFISYSQSLDKNDQPLHNLLKDFGKLIPEYSRGNSPQDAPGTLAGRREGWIDLSLVCFHTLHKVATVKIEWVDCLSLHLEFDSRARVLKLFRYPSLCFLMCCNEERSTMSRIFDDSASASSGSSRADSDDAIEYFKEVLLSYRLIFGQTKNSHQDFRKQSRKWPELQKQPDPMLLILCGHSWETDESRQIFEEIGADDPSNHYSPISDFPFLGKKLTTLQTYVAGHNPHNITALWHDRRDVSWWWTFWAVIIIGGATLIFALFQSILQVLQVIYSKPP